MPVRGGKKEDKNSKKFQISQFYCFFSCDAMAVKGLIPEVCIPHNTKIRDPFAENSALWKIPSLKPVCILGANIALNAIATYRNFSCLASLLKFLPFRLIRSKPHCCLPIFG